MGYESENFMWKLNYILEAYSGVRQFRDENDALMTYSKESQTCLYRLIDYVSEGSYVDSNELKFICKHWNKKPAELVRLWKEETGKDKSTSCFRTQRWSISNILLNTFDDIVGDLLDDKPERLIRILDALQKRTDKVFNDLFISELQIPNSSDIEVNNYNIEEMAYEIDLLRKYNLEEFNRVLSKADSSKLFYIKRILNQDMISSVGINNRKMLLMEEIFDSKSDLSKSKTEI